MMTWCDSALNFWRKVRSHIFILLYLEGSQIQNFISAAKLPPTKYKYLIRRKIPLLPSQGLLLSRWMRVLLIIFPFTTYIASETLWKKIQPPQSHFQNRPPELPKPLSLTSTTTVPEHRRRIYPATYPAHIETTPSWTSDIVNHDGQSPPNLETIHSSTTLPEPLQLRSRPPHRSRFADAFVLRAGSSSAITPEPLHRRCRAWTGSASPTPPCTSLRII